MKIYTKNNCTTKFSKTNKHTHKGSGLVDLSQLLHQQKLFTQRLIVKTVSILQSMILSYPVLDSQLTDDNMFNGKHVALAVRNTLQICPPSVLPSPIPLPSELYPFLLLPLLHTFCVHMSPTSYSSIVLVLTAQIQ